jgi:hypothetical protein
MSKITLDKELRVRLNGLNEQVEVCDEDGKVVGRFLPEDQFRQLLYQAVEAACPHSQEERARRRAETGGKSLADFWQQMGVK